MLRDCLLLLLFFAIATLLAVRSTTAPIFVCQCSVGAQSMVVTAWTGHREQVTMQ